ncbi:ferrous iron transporter B [Alitiscatomonas aceti]|uniref:Ferrous iron transporter B n=1 Tax=Alitiscatomonas aceti TaxID=2981724 RepID=A0ABT2UYX7_9FIRM|nr:ferrous iron transporter B [Alitiscatomonas aceti]MCU6799825.1 ferrous iron transporter B [Alitiscatomonas aceti]
MTRRVALMGNPNVGKSTIFNGLTRLRQHTGNWAGVTVSCAMGQFSYGGQDFSAVDLPGIYSFDTRSAEEELTKDFILNEDYDFLLVVCDATCLERGLYLLSQAAGLLEHREEAGPMPQAVLCVNLCDEAEKKGIRIDFKALERSLGIPVTPCCGRTAKGLLTLKKLLASLAASCPCACASCSLGSPYRRLPSAFSPKDLAAQAVTYTKEHYRKREERLDRILTGPFTGTAVMVLLLLGIFWLTITGANYPSSMLWDLFFSLEPRLAEAALSIGLPQWFIDMAVFGVYRVVAWIVSVMLPPMAIFFPLFTLLEDLGYLPRAAFNMDGAFHKCSACGKQCLTMAMGLGCNAAGVVGCRIIDSPRERLIAILTNSLMPCNGRFPLLLTMIALLGAGGGVWAGLPMENPVLSSLLTALVLTLFILAAILATLGASFLLSRTLLKGVPSSFTLELPPYRRPQPGKVIVRSIFDRTLFVLGRAVAVAAPAGLVIWLLANLTVGGESLLMHIAGFLDPLGALMGLDGIILMAFILGFPANEIVLPIILMAYLQSGVLAPMDDKTAILSLLSANGWTVKTAVCMAVFSLFHWPCSTTCLTIKKETGSLKWTAVSILLPTGIGVLLCILVNLVF